jgi:hypothetical protein
MIKLMKINSKLLILAAVFATLCGCNDFLDEPPQSQIEASNYPNDLISAETAITGCYNRLFDQNCLPFLQVFIQVSTDDISQPNGAFFQHKNRKIMKSVDINNAPWNGMFKTIANVNYLLQKIDGIPLAAFADKPERKTQITAEAHFIRGVAYYYLSVAWGDVPIITTFPKGTADDMLVPKNNRTDVIAFAKAELELAEAGLPNVLTNYTNDPVTNQRKGRASKWAAKAYLARLALQENNWQKALTYSNEIIESNNYPFTKVWRTIYDHPMNASESIFEQQNDFSPGFFGSGLYGWFFGYEFEWSAEAMTIFEQPTEIGKTQGKDVRFDYTYKPVPNKYAPVRQYADGGIESMNIIQLRLTEILFNKAETMNELDFAGNKQAVVDILNQIRARALDPDFQNTFFPNQPRGTTGIAPLDPASFTTVDELRTAIRLEKRREMMFEDVIRWVDLYRWDKEYLKTICGATSDDHLFLPIPPDEIVRDANLVQNPAYN